MKKQAHYAIWLNHILRLKISTKIESKIIERVTMQIWDKIEFTAIVFKNQQDNFIMTYRSIPKAELIIMKI
jgi:hypothetical protein